MSPIRMGIGVRLRICVWRGAPSRGPQGQECKGCPGGLCGANGLTGQLGMLMEIVCDVMSF